MPCIQFQPLLESNDMMSGCCSHEWLRDQLSGNEGRGILLLDCRTLAEFNVSHIEHAINVSIPCLMLRRLKKGNLSVATVINCNEGKEKFNKRCKTDTVVLYDDRSRDVATDPSSVISLLVKRLEEDGCTTCILRGGFEEFQKKYPEMCYGYSPETDEQPQTIMGLQNLQIRDPEEDSEELSPTNCGGAFPVEVMPFLFLGNAKNSADRECLYRNKIKYIINVTPNVPNTFVGEEDSFKYLQIPISDHWSQNLSAYFHEAISFIDEARHQKCGVLVHCLAGISRSVTVTLAYLMHELSLSLNDAYDYVKQCKPNISPNFNFMGQLLDFERSLRVEECQCPEGSQCDCNKVYFSSPAPTSSSDMSSTPSSSTTYESEEPSPS